MFGLNENNTTQANSTTNSNSVNNVPAISHAQSAMPNNPFNEEDEIGMPMTTAPPDPVISPQGQYPSPDPVPSSVPDPIPPPQAPTMPDLPTPPSMPAEPPAPEPQVVPPAASGTPKPADDLLDLKEQALHNLQPLVGHLDQSPEEKFKTTMMLIQATDNSALVKEAYEAANHIPDEKIRARALLDVVNEINYFTQHQGGEPEPKV